MSQPEAWTIADERPDLHQQVLQAVDAALDETLEGTADGPARQGAETVLIGDGGLDSLALVTFAGILEEELLQVGVSVSVIDVILVHTEGCTAGELAASVAARAGRP